MSDRHDCAKMEEDLAYERERRQKAEERVEELRRKLFAQVEEKNAEWRRAEQAEARATRAEEERNAAIRANDDILKALTHVEEERDRLWKAATAIQDSYCSWVCGNFTARERERRAHKAECLALSAALAPTPPEPAPLPLGHEYVGSMSRGCAFTVPHGDIVGCKRRCGRPRADHEPAPERDLYTAEECHDAAATPSDEPAKEPARWCWEVVADMTCGRKRPCPTHDTQEPR